jgi:hypothetical protein
VETRSLPGAERYATIAPALGVEYGATLETSANELNSNRNTNHRLSDYDA